MNNDRFKFRAWDKEEKRMSPVHDIMFGWCEPEIYPDGISVGVTMNYNHFTVDDGEMVLDDGEDIKNCSLNDVILMQSTGLRDKNGKLIFEGDIVKDDMEDFYSVEWGYAGKDFDTHAECFVLTPVNHDGDIAQLSFNEALKSEIIGNIYTTPELLSHNNLKDEK